MVSISIPIREYSPLIYANLHELDVVKQWIELYKPLTSTLNDVIRAYGVGDMLGVALLHKHFHLYADERLVREISNEGIDISPKNSTTLNTVSFIWAFSKDQVNETFGCYPVEFVAAHDALARFEEASKVIHENANFRTDYFRVLASAGATNVLGLGLNVGALFTFTPGHQLMETESSLRGARHLKLRIRPEVEFEGKEVIQTLWL